MSFVTASGKDVKVSEEALERARRLFEELDNDDHCCGQASNKGQHYSSPGNSNLTPLTPVSNVSSRRNIKRVASTFKSPVIKSPRLEENVIHNDGFSTPVKNISTLGEPSTPTTPKNTICGEVRNITPIKLLTPYCKNWRLCIKVTSVDEMRFYRGQHVFSFLAVDDSGVEIRLSAFGDVAYKTAAIIRPEQMYYVTRASVKMTSRRYSRNQHDMEVVLRPDSEVTECTDRPQISSPKMNFEFVRIQNLHNFVDTEIDVLGILIGIGEMRQLKSKTGEELQKREVQIADDSGHFVNVTLWGQKAKAFSDKHYQHVLAAKGLFVRCFQGTISLVAMTSSKLLYDPHFPEANALRLWYNENKGKTFKPASMNQVLSFDEHRWIGRLKYSTIGDVCNVTAMISSIITENAIYKGCPGCKKKLLVEKDGDLYICSKCGICSEYKCYYTLHMELFDFTGTVQVTAFDGCAQKLIGEEADEVVKFMKFNNERYEAYFRNALFKPYMFRLHARKRENTDNLVASAKTVQACFWLVMDLIPMPFDRYCTFLQRTIETFGDKTSTEE